MARLLAIDPTGATGKAKTLLDQVRAKLGRAPNMMRTMANSPAVLQAYLAMNEALAEGALSAKLREQIALAVGEANGCQYCVSAHSMLGKLAGLHDNEVAASREATAGDPKTDTALKFARTVVRERGQVGDHDIRRLRDAGYTDGEIAEIIAAVALNVFTNYFNVATGVEIDFPPVARAVQRAS